MQAHLLTLWCSRTLRHTCQMTLHIWHCTCQSYRNFHICFRKRTRLRLAPLRNCNSATRSHNAVLVILIPPIVDTNGDELPRDTSIGGFLLFECRVDKFEFRASTVVWTLSVFLFRNGDTPFRSWAALGANSLLYFLKFTKTLCDEGIWDSNRTFTLRRTVTSHAVRRHGVVNTTFAFGSICRGFESCVYATIFHFSKLISLA